MWNHKSPVVADGPGDSSFILIVSDISEPKNSIFPLYLSFISIMDWASSYEGEAYLKISIQQADLYCLQVMDHARYFSFHIMFFQYKEIANAFE